MMLNLLKYSFKIHSSLIRRISKVRLFFYLKQFNSVGDNVTISFPVRIEGKDCVTIGSNTAIGTFTHIWGNGGVEIGSGVLIGAHCCITSINHDYRNSTIRDGGSLEKRVVIEDDVWLGYNVIIVPGIRVGKGSVIGAGSVVVTDVPEFSIVVGNPARIVKKRNIS